MVRICILADLITTAYDYLRKCYRTDFRWLSFCGLALW